MCVIKRKSVSYGIVFREFPLISTFGLERTQTHTVTLLRNNGVDDGVGGDNKQERLDWISGIDIPGLWYLVNWHPYGRFDLCPSCFVTRLGDVVSIVKRSFNSHSRQLIVRG